MNPDQNKIQASTKNRSKDRLLHSSFYLYKLNAKSSANTPKAILKPSDNQN